ncbi:MAG: hypothetical protein IKI58_01680 [Oscillospiraceae bacterium]|nr:hypothetical protein [Oscillospiraceae bacterium]
MLGKLIKHEFIYLIKDFTRTYIIYGAVVLILKLLLSIAIHDNDPGTALTTLLIIFLIIYYIFTLILALLTISHNSRRFKKNMFSHEGYLTNTLPVTPTQHIIAKVIVGAVNYILSFFVIFIGIEVLLSGIGIEKYLSRWLSEYLDYLDDIGILFPMFLQLATGYLAFLLFCYLISSVSSMIGGSKGLAALLAIGIIIAYIFIITVMSVQLEDSTESAKMYVFSLFHAILAAIEFGTVIYIIKNKLNLQ